MYIYIADSKYESSLFKVQIKKETNCRYIPVRGTYEDIIGSDASLHDWRSYFSKRKFNCFATGQEALTWLRERARERVIRDEKMLKRSKDEYARLQNFRLSEDDCQ